MASTTIRSPNDTHAVLRRLAQDHTRTVGQIVAEAVDRYDRERALTALNTADARISADPRAAANWQVELRSLNGTLSDGLADDPWAE